MEWKELETDNLNESMKMEIDFTYCIMGQQVNKYDNVIFIWPESLWTYYI